MGAPPRERSGVARGWGGAALELIKLLDKMISGGSGLTSARPAPRPNATTPRHTIRSRGVPLKHPDRADSVQKNKAIGRAEQGGASLADITDGLASPRLAGIGGEVGRGGVPSPRTGIRESRAAAAGSVFVTTQTDAQSAQSAQSPALARGTKRDDWDNVGLARPRPPSSPRHESVTQRDVVPASSAIAVP